MEGSSLPSLGLTLAHKSFSMGTNQALSCAMNPQMFYTSLLLLGQDASAEASVPPSSPENHTSFLISTKQPKKGAEQPTNMA